jgi:hypothetical protein
MDPEKLKMYLMFSQPFVHGNPGNMSVMSGLMDIGCTVDLSQAEPKFYQQNPKYDKNIETGWLWIIYKDLCGKDIEKTNEYLKEL